MWWLNYHGMLTIYGGNGWVLLVSGFVNKYTYFDVVRKYKLLVDEHVLKKREVGERAVKMVGIVFFFLSTSLSLKSPFENDPP